MLSKINEKLEFVEKLDKVWFYTIAMPSIIAIITFIGAKIIGIESYMFIWSYFASLLMFGNFANSIRQSKEQHNKFPKITFSIFLVVKVIIMILYSFVMMALFSGNQGGTEVAILLGLIHIFVLLTSFGLTFIQDKLFLKIDTSFVNNFATHLITSISNPNNILRGFKWSEFKEIEKSLNEGVYIDNFQIVDDKIKPTKKELEKISNFDIKIKPVDLTKTTLCVGKAGSGKTQYFLNLANQNTNFQYFKRELYHDVKGDFVEKLYDEKTDFILNLYDKRSLNWDIWEDMQQNESVINSFTTNLITSQVDKPDFWTSSASSLLIDLIRKVHFTNSELSSSEKWQKLLDLLENYKQSIDDDKTKQSIWQTLELALSTIKMMAYDGIFSNKKSFSLYKWANSYDSRLFLLNNASYSKSLNPYFTGFLACLIEILLSKPDTKSDFTLMVLDEYLSLKLDEDVRLKMLTQIRSKGGCLVLGVQYLDASDKKQKQLIGSSTYIKLLFNVSDDETVDTFVKAYGNVEYEKHKISTSTSTSDNKGGGAGSRSVSTSTSTSTEDKNLPFLTPEIIKSLTNFKHLTLIDEKQFYYVGYTKAINLPTKNMMFEKKDLTDFYKWNFNSNDVKIEAKKQEVEKSKIDLIFEKPFEYRKEIFEALENVENMTIKELDDIIDTYDLIDVDLQDFINRYIDSLED